MQPVRKAAFPLEYDLQPFEQSESTAVWPRACVPRKLFHVPHDRLPRKWWAIYKLGSLLPFAARYLPKFVPPSTGNYVVCSIRHDGKADTTTVVINNGRGSVITAAEPLVIDTPLMMSPGDPLTVRCKNTSDKRIRFVIMVQVDVRDEKDTKQK